MIHRSKRLWLIALGIVSLATEATAQTAGRLTGYVSDPSNSAIGSVAVTVESNSTGQRREVVTDSAGLFVIPELPVGQYTLTAQKEGFRPYVRPAVSINVGQSVTLQVELALGPVTESIVVTADAPAVSTHTAPGTAFVNRQVIELPINGRDYARFSLLASGAVARTNLVADISFNGMHTVHNQFSIDGVDASRVDQPYMSNGFERGARLLTGSLETIAEFRVQTGNYQAQYGRAAGSFINIATRSGSNQIHGTLFEFFRNDALDARNFFNTKPSEQARYRYNDFGGNLGGPVIRNRTFLFANYEGSRQRIGITGTGTTPSRQLHSLALAASPVLEPILGSFPEGTAPTANPLVDLCRLVNVSAVREDTGSVRLDHSFSTFDTAYVRYNLNDTRVTGPLFGVSASALGRFDRQDVPVRTSNLAINHQHIFGSAFLSETLVGVQRFNSELISDGHLPLVSVSGLTAAPGYRGRTATRNMSLQLGNTMSLIRGVHSWKWGGSAYRIDLGRRSADTTVLLYTSINDFVNNSAAAAVHAVGDPGSTTLAYQSALFVQNTIQVKSGLSVDLGLRYDFATPPFDPDKRAQTYDPKTESLASPGVPYFKTNRNNWAPRLALGWQMSKRLVVRSGFGVFWQAYPVGYGSYAIPTNNLTGSTNLLREQVPRLGYPVAPLLGSGVAPVPSVTGFPWDKPDVRARHWNVTLETLLFNGFTAEVAYVGNHAVNLRRNLDTNLFDPALQRRPNPAFSSINLEMADGRSSYNALQLALRRRFSAGAQIGVNYTWGHALDDVQDSGMGSAQPQNRLDLQSERGNGAADIRHNLSYSMIYTLPLFHRHGKLGGWQIASVGILRSGVPLTVNISRNAVGDGNSSNQRPDAVLGVSPYPVQRTVDEWLNPAAFQMPPAGRFGNLGRNTLRGPGLTQLDASVLKDTFLAEAVRLQVRVEVFNLLNHPNFALPDTVLGSASFGRISNTLGRTIGLGTSRQIQLAAKFFF